MFSNFYIQLFPSQKQSSFCNVNVINLFSFKQCDIFVFFNSYKVPSIKAATKNEPLPKVLSKITSPRICIRSYHIPPQFYWLLCGMQNRPLAFSCFDIYNICRVSFSFARNMNWFKITIIPTQLILSCTFIIWYSLCHLWMICRLFFIKHTYVLVLSKRLFLGIQKICRF